MGSAAMRAAVVVPVEVGFVRAGVEVVEAWEEALAAEMAT